MLLRLGLVGLVSCVLAAQTGGENLTIGGVVVNSATGEPIQRALVTAIRFNLPKKGERFAPGQPFIAKTFTDTGGAFRFSGLAAGRYNLSAEKSHFLSGESPKTSEGLDLTSSLEGSRITLTPLGVITGKVTDTDGEPLRGVNILALSASVNDGVRVTHADRNVVTDDRGMFRLWNLQPGKYFLKAAGMQGGTFTYSGDTNPQLFAEESFVPVYYGGAQTLDSAAPLTVPAGTEAQADFSLKMQPSYKIRGTVSNFVPHQSAVFQLLASEEDVSPSRVTVNNETGRFEIQDVLPGTYVLRATQRQTSGEAAVTVGATDVNGVNLVLSPAVEVRGTVRWTNSGTLRDPGGRAILERMGNQCEVRLHRGEKTISSQFEENGEFVMKNVLPANYRVSVTCFDGYANSVAAGRQDLLANSLLRVGSGAETSIEVVATHGGGKVHATVRTANETSEEDLVQALLVPTSGGNTGPALEPCRWQAQAEYRCDFSRLAPGVYTAYAFLKREDIEFRNPAFLASLSGGVSVQVEENTQKTVNLEVAR
jgi:hypothetical protein